MHVVAFRQPLGNNAHPWRPLRPYAEFLLRIRRRVQFGRYPETILYFAAPIFSLSPHAIRSVSLSNEPSPARLPWMRTDLGRLFSDSTLVFAVRLGAALITYVTQVLLARWMGASELGVFVYALSWLWILNVLCVMGLSSSASRFIPSYRANGQLGLARGYIRFSRRAVAAVGVAVALLGAGALLIARTTDGDITLALALVALPFVALTTLQSGIARSCLWFLFASFSGVLLRPALLLLAVLVAWKLGVAPSATRVMAMLAMIIVVIMVAQYFGLRRRLGRVLEPGPCAVDGPLWMKVATPIVLSELFVSYFIDVNVILIAVHVPPAEVAVFNAALRTVAIIAFGIFAVGAVIAPRAARLFEENDLDGLQRLVRTGTHLMFWPALLAFVLLLAFGKIILGFFGPEFVRGYDILLIGAVAQVVIASFGPVLQVLNVAGQQNRCLVVFATALVLTLVLYWLLVPAMGMVGGAIAFLLVSMVWSGWLNLLVRRHVRIRPSLFGRRPRQP